jgi:hypothetical protein
VKTMRSMRSAPRQGRAAPVAPQIGGHRIGLGDVWRRGGLLRQRATGRVKHALHGGSRARGGPCPERRVDRGPQARRLTQAQQPWRGWIDRLARDMNDPLGVPRPRRCGICVSARHPRMVVPAVDRYAAPRPRHRPRHRPRRQSEPRRLARSPAGMARPIEGGADVRLVARARLKHPRNRRFPRPPRREAA